LDLPGGHASGRFGWAGLWGIEDICIMYIMYIILLCGRDDDGGRSGKLVLAAKMDTVLKKINKQKHRP